MRSQDNFPSFDQLLFHTIRKTVYCLHTSYLCTLNIDRCRYSLLFDVLYSHYMIYTYNTDSLWSLIVISFLIAKTTEKIPCTGMFLTWFKSCMLSVLTFITGKLQEKLGSCKLVEEVELTLNRLGGGRLAPPSLVFLPQHSHL